MSAIGTLRAACDDLQAEHAQLIEQRDGLYAALRQVLRAATDGQFDGDALGALQTVQRVADQAVAATDAREGRT